MQELQGIPKSSAVHSSPAAANPRRWPEEDSESCPAFRDALSVVSCECS